LVKITELCNQAGWTAAGIGSRYLRVMMLVLAFEPDEAKVSISDLQHYKTVLAAAQTMIEVMKDRIHKQTLSRGDKQLFMNLVDIYTCLSYQLQFAESPL
jgi:hypothetical protein